MAQRDNDESTAGLQDARSEIADMKPSGDSHWSFGDHAGRGLVVGSADGATIELATLAFARMYGYGADELTGCTVAELLEPERRANVAEKIRVVCEEGHHTWESRHVRKDGTTFPVLIDAAAVKDASGRVLRVVADVEDISHPTRLGEALEALRESEQMLKTVTDAIPDPIFLKDRDGRCLFANPATLALLGKSLDQVLGKTDLEVHDDPRTARALMENERRIMESGVAAVVEETVRTPHGDRFLVTSKVPFRDLDDRVIGLVGNARDITERKQIEEALKASEQALRLSESQMVIAQQLGHAGSWIYDVASERIWGSAEALRIFGYPPLARYWALEDIEACIPERERVHGALVALITEGRPYDLEYAIRPADGSPAKEVHSIATIERDARGAPVRVMGFVQDITERKQAENTLRRLASDLAEANRLKDVFTDVLRHDILNPVGVIKMATELLLQKETDSVKISQLERVRRSTSNIAEMTRNAANLALVAAGQASEFLDADPVQALRAVILDFDDVLHEKGITLTDRSALGAFSARFNPILKEVFANLISNAIKYSPHRSRIDTSVEDVGDSWIFSVRDEGPGVPDAHKQRIFDRFERLQKVGVKGSGLGLTITRAIVKLHGGEIWVEDAPQGGSRFVVRLPKDPPAASPSTAKLV